MKPPLPFPNLALPAAAASQMRRALALALLVPWLTWAATPQAEPDGEQRATFQKYSSCPSTGMRSGHCPGYQIIFKVPPCAGGSDRWTNMAWMDGAAFRERQRRAAGACPARSH